MLTLSQIKSEVGALAEKYKLLKVDLFGSYATGHATEKSDADFLVEFNMPIPSIFLVMGFKEELAERLQHPVDVVTYPIVKPEMLKVVKVMTVYERT